MTCLDDDTVLGLVEGRLAAAAVAQLDVHLDSCASCRAVIAQVSRANVVENGRSIGRYVLGDLLGTGAMGRVYTAWERDLDRHVAIKLLRDDSDSARARLLREAQSMARLAHPNVVAVHEVGTTADGVFVAMELVDGDTLRTWARETRSWRDKVGLLVDIARGLAAVHAAGVIHRDVKPDNIIVGRDGRARLGDFGLARAHAAPPDPPAPWDGVLATTCAAGTPAYMAPELLSGDPATVASDQFSFGVTAYEVLAGSRPFPGRSWAELVASIDERTLAPPPGPRWLHATLVRCLAADPAKRFPSMQAVALALGSRLHRRRWPVVAVAAAAVVASTATWFVVRRAPAPPKESGEQQLASVWNASVRGRIASRWSPSPDAPAALAAIDRWAGDWVAQRDAPGSTVVRDACLDRRRVDFAALVGRLDGDSTGGSVDSRVGGSAAVASRLGGDAAVDSRVGGDAAVDSRVGGGSALAIDRVVDAVAALAPPRECRLASLGADPVPADRIDRVNAVIGQTSAVRAAISLGDARPVFDRSAAAVEAARALGHAPTLGDALLVRTEAQRATDRFADAAISARDAVAAAERGHDDALAARAWLARVSLAQTQRALEQADDLAAIASASIDRAGAPPSLVARLALLRGEIAYDRGDLGAAATFVIDARERFVALATDSRATDSREATAVSIDVTAADSLLGSIARGRGDLDEALRRHRGALATDRLLRGPAHPDVARDLHNIAGVLRLGGHLDEAAATYREALAIEIATRGEHSVEAGLTHNSLGLVAMAHHDWPAATGELERARDALAGHGDLALAEHNLGLVAAAIGNHSVALAHYARAAAVYHATIGDADALPIRLLVDTGRSELAVGHRATARDLANRARTTARAAGIDWIADDAERLAASVDNATPSARPPVAVASPVPVESPHAPIPAPVESPHAPIVRPPPPVASPTPPIASPQQPKRDVGAYGASQP